MGVDKLCPASRSGARKGPRCPDLPFLFVQRFSEMTSCVYSTRTLLPPKAPSPTRGLCQTPPGWTVWAGGGEGEGRLARSSDKGLGSPGLEEARLFPCSPVLTLSSKPETRASLSFPPPLVPVCWLQLLLSAVRRHRDGDVSCRQEGLQLLCSRPGLRHQRGLPAPGGTGHLPVLSHRSENARRPTRTLQNPAHLI